MRYAPGLLALWLVFIPGAAAAQQSAGVDEPNAEYYFVLGRHLEGQGKVEEAVVALQHAIQLAPGSAEPSAELAGLYARQDHAPEAVQAAEAALKIDSRNREANRVLGSVLAALIDAKQPLRPGDDLATYPTRAIAALEIARGDGTGELGVDLSLARLYLDQQRPADAVPLLRRIYLESPGYVDGALLLVRAQEESGHVDEALETLNGVLENDPGQTRALILRGELLERERRWKEAASTWQSLQQAMPGNTEVSARRAIALLNAGDADGAEAAARALRAAKPDDVRGTYILGLTLSARNHFDEALPLLEQAAKAAPDNTAILFQYAGVLDRTGRQADAERIFRDIIAKDPTDAGALNYLGYMLADNHRQLDEAVTLIQRALTIEPDNPSFLDSLGWAYLQGGKVELADSPLTTAAGKEPRNSVIQDHLGDLRLRQRRKADAIEAWQRALAGDGEAIDRARIEKKIAEASK